MGFLLVHVHGFGGRLAASVGGAWRFGRVGRVVGAVERQRGQDAARARRRLLRDERLERGLVDEGDERRLGLRRAAARARAHALVRRRAAPRAEQLQRQTRVDGPHLRGQPGGQRWRRRPGGRGRRRGRWRRRRRVIAGHVTVVRARVAGLLFVEVLAGEREYGHGARRRAVELERASRRVGRRVLVELVVLAVQRDDESRDGAVVVRPALLALRRARFGGLVSQKVTSVVTRTPISCKGISLVNEETRQRSVPRWSVNSTLGSKRREIYGKPTSHNNETNIRELQNKKKSSRSSTK